MEGGLVGERGVEGGEQVLMIKSHLAFKLVNSVTNTEDEDSNSAAFLSDDLLYLLVDCLEVVEDLCLGAVDDELHVGDGKAFRVHHLLLRNLAEVGG